MRNLGMAFAYALIAYQSVVKGNEKLEVNTALLASELADQWGVLAEAVQCVMRRYNIADAYEQLKALTRGRKVTKTRLHQFIKALELPEQVKKELLALTPAQYTGLAAPLVRAFS